MQFDSLLQTASARLTSSGLAVVSNPSLPDGIPTALAASRTFWTWKGLVIFSQHVLLRRQESATPRDLMAFFEAGLAYAKSVNRVPLLPGMQFGYMILPCLAVDHADDDLIAFASCTPRQHFSIFEFPVVLDLGTNQMHYFTGTSPWGAFFFSDLRALVEHTFWA